MDGLFSNGSKISAGPLRIVYLLTESEHPALQVGTGVSSRNFKKATDRNRIRRLIREAWRLQKKDLEQKVRMGTTKVIVFIMYTGKELPAYEVIFNKTGSAIHKLMELV